MYIWSAFAFFVAGGIMALIVRLQLSHANAEIATGDSFNALTTMHGTVMVFLFAMPILAGIANYLVPLMIGAADMAFPRLNALSLWLYLIGAIVLIGSFGADGGAATAGWTSYTPLSGPEYSPQIGQDLWILGLHLVGVSSLIGSINFLVTIVNMRAPGMTWRRIPLFVWSMVAQSILILLTVPVIAAALLLLLLDRAAGTEFLFRPAAAPSSTSTSSGSSGTRRCTSSSCPRSGSSPRSCPCSHGSRSSATPRWRSRASASRSSR